MYLSRPDNKEMGVTDFFALIGDCQLGNEFFGVLICRSIVPGLFHWYVLGSDDQPLLRGTLKCTQAFETNQECIQFIQEHVAYEIGVDIHHIQPLDEMAQPFSLPTMLASLA